MKPLKSKSTSLLNNMSSPNWPIHRMSTIPSIRHNNFSFPRIHSLQDLMRRVVRVMARHDSAPIPPNLIIVIVISRSVVIPIPQLRVPTIPVRVFFAAVAAKCDPDRSQAIPAQNQKEPFPAFLHPLPMANAVLVQTVVLSTRVTFALVIAIFAIFRAKIASSFWSDFGRCGAVDARVSVGRGSHGDEVSLASFAALLGRRSWVIVFAVFETGFWLLFGGGWL